ncbi:unannotated protein [freshwater metagenome]|uniref:Unannotated protein n=1 Tax=freshwater metagenome TaxID=449393 RepID=A0A6J7HHV6_9ZZZZ
MFGNSGASHLSWRDAQTPLDEALLAAAKKQCNLAFTIRITGGARMPPPALARAIGLHPDTVRDILNGSKHANLAVLHAMTATLGKDLAIKVHARAPADDSGQR